MRLDQSWPALLQKAWQDQKIKHTLINASISGNTSHDGRVRLDKLLTTHKPEWVLIALGGNDGLQGIAIQTTQKNLESLISAVKKSGAKPILMQIKLPRNYGPRFINLFEKMYTTLAERYKIPLMPFIVEAVAFDPKLMRSDGIHPNEHAQPILAGKAYEVLTPLLEHNP